jgi:hypothetical protein
MIQKIPKDKTKGIHRGEVTHHQDHLIVLVSFKTKRITNR